MTVLFGDNFYERDAALRHLKKAFDGEIITQSGDELSLPDLPDLFMGQTLFSDKRMVVIKNLSENTELWQKIEQWFGRISSDTTLILVEDKPDKRTSSWKFLQKNAEVRSFIGWTKKDIHMAVEWAQSRAKKTGFDLTTANARYMIERAGAEQYALAGAIEKLSLAGGADKATIDNVTDEKPEDTAFGLLEQSLGGDIKGIQQTITILKRTEEPYRVMALLASQLVQLAVVSGSEGKTSTELAKDVGAAPFVITRLQRVAGKYSPRYLQLAAETDYAMKTTNAQPWELVERLLLGIASR